MAKVHPQAPVSSTSCYFSSKQEVFTIWMKSLILSSNGCTVFDSNGQIVYRVDNYDHKCSDEVYLMDFRGQVLFTILKKVKKNTQFVIYLLLFYCFIFDNINMICYQKYKLFGEWEGYRSTVTKAKNRICPDFQVRRSLGFLRRESPCEVVAGLDKTQKFHCKIEKWNGKAACKIVDKLGGLIAEVYLFLSLVFSII